VSSGGELNLFDLTLRNGRSDFGGAILSDGVLALTNVWLIDNAATNDGGGIRSSGQLSIDGSTLRNNTAGDGGGGISHFGISLTIRNSRFENNDANIAGGIGILSDGTAQSVIQPSLE
jgi:predicted outer membrane repeat protein